MSKEVLSVAFKEIRQFTRDPKIIIPIILVPLIMMPMMGHIIGLSRQAQTHVKVAILNMDEGGKAQTLIKFLEHTSNIELTKVATADIENIQHDALIVIPNEFSQNITTGHPATIEVYVSITGAGIADANKVSTINLLLNSYRQVLLNQKYNITNLLTVSGKSIIRNKVIDVDPVALTGSLASQSVSIPTILMVLLIFAIQIVATSMASEKEEKTLESLLSLPISRLSILTGKLLGSTFITALSALAFLIGYRFFTNTALPSAELGQKVNLFIPSGVDYALIGTSLFMALLSGLAMALCISMLGEDVRGTQSLIVFLYPLIFLPMFATMFIDIYALPPYVLLSLLLIPFVHPIVVLRALFLGNYLIPIASILYTFLFIGGIIYLSARIFSSEKLLTAGVRVRKKASNVSSD
jgi:ABC-2 type transport system permease protein